MPLSPEPDLASQARRIRSGDLAAFESLFRRLHPPLSRLALSLAPTTGEAEDAVQEAFARLWERRERIDPELSLDGYLARSVRNRLLNAVRDTQARRDRLDERAAAAAPSPARPDELAHAATLRERLGAALQSLPTQQRRAIALTRFGGFSHAEAADAMDCSARTVNNHIVRGLRTLRDRLRALGPDA